MQVTQKQKKKRRRGYGSSTNSILPRKILKPDTTPLDLEPQLHKSYLETLLSCPSGMIWHLNFNPFRKKREAKDSHRSFKHLQSKHLTSHKRQKVIQKTRTLSFSCICFEINPLLKPVVTQREELFVFLR